MMTADAASRPRRRRRRLWVLAAVPAVVVVAAVGLFVWGQLQPKPPGFAPTDPDEGATVTEAWVRYTVDASDRDSWVFFDFERGRVVESSFERGDWHLAFRRTGLLTNSGVTNPDGPGGAAEVGETPLELAVVPLSATFHHDVLGGEDGDEPRNPVISRWYDYHFIRHVVLAKEKTFLVRTGGRRDAMVQFDSYYCGDESPGCVTFRYRLVPRVAHA